MEIERPTTEQLLSNALVRAAFAAAWADSLADDDELRHEEGGWILMNTANGRITVRRELPGALDELAFRRPDVDLPFVILAMYHTHPTPVALGGKPDPSEEDCEIVRDLKLPSFVIAESAIFTIDTDGTVSLGAWL